MKADDRFIIIWVGICVLGIVALFIMAEIKSQTLESRIIQTQEKKIIVFDEGRVLAVHKFQQGLKWPDCIINEKFCKAINTSKKTEILETEKAYYIKIGKD